MGHRFQLIYSSTRCLLFGAYSLGIPDHEPLGAAALRVYCVCRPHAEHLLCKSLRRGKERARRRIYAPVRKLLPDEIDVQLRAQLLLVAAVLFTRGGSRIWSVARGPARGGDIAGSPAGGGNLTLDLPAAGHGRPGVGVGKGVPADQPVDALAQAPQATVERACVLAEYRASAAGIERSWRTAGAPRVLTCALLRCLAWLARGMPAAESAVCLPSKHCVLIINRPGEPNR